MADRQPIQLSDDGFEFVEVAEPDGTKKTAKLDVYIVGYECKRVYREWEAAGKPDAGLTKALVDLFASHGLPGLSGKAATALGVRVQELMGETEKKSEATPPPA